MLKDNYYSVLFTGGLDSSYRLCQLAQDEKAIIQPIYILFPDDGHIHKRPELQRELEAQDKILAYIQAQPQTKAKFLSIKRIHRDAIPKDQRIMDLEGELSEYKFGWQYLYIALLIRWQSGLELCHETLPPELLNNKVKFKKINNRICTDCDKSDSLFVELFKDVTWPILNVSRKQMIEDIKNWGYSDIYNLIWFCYDSVDGKPCGFCDNCSVKISEGLTFLFTKEAIHRYLVFSFIFYCLPNYTRDLYRKYVKNQIRDGMRDSELRWIKRFSKIELLNNDRLKKMIIEGTVEYNDSKTQCLNRILKFRNDTERRDRLLRIFKNI